MSCDLPIDEQIEAFVQHAYVAECNESMAQIQGYSNAEAMRGAALDAVLVRSPGNQDGLRAFVRAGYRLSDVEAVVISADGNRRTLRHNLVGIIHDGMFVGVWGTTRDVTPLQRAEALARGQVEALTRTVGHLADAPNLDALLGHVLYEIRQQVDAEMGYIFVYDPTNDTLDLHTSVHDGQVQRGACDEDPPFFHAPFPAAMIPSLETLQTTRQVLITSAVEAHFAWPDASGLSGNDHQREVAALALLAGDQLVGVLGLTFRTAPPLSEADTQLIQTLGQQAALAMQLTRLAHDARQLAVLEERTRLAREIHDTLAQGFTGIIVQLQAAEEIAATNHTRQSSPHIEQALALARTSLAEARRSMQALRAPALVGTDLGGALLRLVQQRTAHTAITATFAVSGTPVALPAEVEGQLLRIGQEAIANALKHARARQLQVELRFDTAAVRLQIHDDGIGFVPTQVEDGRYGLIGMRERAQQLGAALIVQSVPEHGTMVTVTVTVPVAEQSYVRTP